MRMTKFPQLIGVPTRAFSRHPRPKLRPAFSAAERKITVRPWATGDYFHPAHSETQPESLRKPVHHPTRQMYLDISTPEFANQLFEYRSGHLSSFDRLAGHRNQGGTRTEAGVAWHHTGPISRRPPTSA
ncbi:hypothetical protein FAGKG844_420009 [Frankia sp. AgKG'84/4]